MDAPSEADLARAFNAGAQVRFGLPAHVRLADGYAVLDLVAAAAGRPGWWSVHHIADDVLDLRSPTDRSVYVAGLLVEGVDLAAVLEAIALAPPEAERHSAAGDAARHAAGVAAARIVNVMVRARLLDALDAWSGVVGRQIDSDPAHGDLHEVPDAEAKAIVVTCPSTGRRYVHRVPLEMLTARDARRWVLDLGPDDLDPENET